MLKIKLKVDSKRLNIITKRGININKDNYVVVNDEDDDIQSIIMNRKDILIQTYSEKITEVPKNKEVESFKETVEEVEEVEEVVLDKPVKKKTRKSKK